MRKIKSNYFDSKYTNGQNELKLREMNISTIFLLFVLLLKVNPKNYIGKTVREHTTRPFTILCYHNKDITKGKF